MKKSHIPKRLSDLEILLEVSKTVTSTLDLEKVIKIVLKEAINVLHSDHASLFLIDERTRRLVLTAVRGFSGDEVENIHLLAGWEKINTEVVRKRSPLIVNDIGEVPQFRKRVFPLRSFLSVPLRTPRRIVGIIIVSNKRSKAQFTIRHEELLVALANQAAIAVLNARLYKDLEELFISTIRALVAAIDAKDPYTHGHSERVTEYSLSIARELRLPQAFLRNLKLTALLHDVGKIGIRDRVLLKRGLLNKDQLAQIRKHPTIGVKIAGSILNSEKIIPGVRDHHEHYNGKGYPYGLKGGDISLEGRIIAVADAYDAMRSDRPYRKALSESEVLSEIKRHLGTQFDPRVAKAFLAVKSKGGA